MAAVHSLPAAAALDDISNADAASSLRRALSGGSAAAVKIPVAENGYFANPKVKILLPPNLQRIESGQRMMGTRKQHDELVLSMNRAAEAAALEARPLLVESVKKISVQDAKAILTDCDTAATDYFCSTIQTRLTQRFLPIVKKATDRVGLAQQYGSLSSRGASLGPVKAEGASIETCVTRKALDGLCLMIAEQEKNFRQNPVGASSEIVKRVFGVLD